MRRILLVAMPSSPHTARWVEMIADAGWELHLFPISDAPVLPEMRGVTIHYPLLTLRSGLMRKAFKNASPGHLRPGKNVRAAGRAVRFHTRSILPIPVLPRLEALLNRVWRVRLGESECLVPGLYGPRLLARLIRKLKPELIHSMEFQHCGYTVLKAREYFPDGFPPWLATNWGSDIYHFRQFEDHRRQISRLLEATDYYSCECERDVALAQELGLRAKVMPVMPNTGGFDLDKVWSLRGVQHTSQRRLIMVKGYQHFAGRAMTAIDALERCADILQQFEIVVYSAGAEVAARARALRRAGVLNFWITEYQSHDEMLHLYARARMYIGISVSDAISTSLLEAMAMGAFPIQTNTACCEEWIEDGVSGFIVPSDDVNLIAERIRLAVCDDGLVDSAAKRNWKTVQARLDHRILSEKARALYDEIFEDLRLRAGRGQKQYLNCSRSLAHPRDGK